MFANHVNTLTQRVCVTSLAFQHPLWRANRGSADEAPSLQKSCGAHPVGEEPS